MFDYCNCNEEKRIQEIDNDCTTCNGTGESCFSPDHSCGSCGGSGVSKELTYFCITCEKEIEDPDVFGDDGDEEEEGV